MTRDEFFVKLKRMTFAKIENKLFNIFILSVLNWFKMKRYYRQRRGQAVFTVDWFQNNVENWNSWLQELKNKPNVVALEIGSYEGRSTRWLLENVLTHPTAKLICIDTLKGSLEHQEDKVNMLQVKRNFFHNIYPFRQKVKLFLNTSHRAIRTTPKVFAPNSFDFIYIDGSHTAFDVLEDAILCFRTLRKNGIMVFDDYEWHRYEEPHLNPQLAIDSWLACFKGQFELVYKGYQLCVRKTVDYAY